jgi:hypothetical protein
LGLVPNGLSASICHQKLKLRLLHGMTLGRERTKFFDFAALFKIGDDNSAQPKFSG